MPKETAITDLNSKCPAFKAGCPYVHAPASLHAAAQQCPAFKTGCPFKEAGSVSNLFKDLAHAPASHATPGAPAHQAVKEAVEYVHSRSMDVESTVGDCPVFKAVKAATAENGSRLVDERLVGDKKIDGLSGKCVAFKSGCPFNGLSDSVHQAAQACPAFEKGCPFKEAGSVHTLYKELDHAPPSHAQPGSAAHKGIEEMMQVVHKTSVSLGQKQGSCPVFAATCPFKYAAAGGQKRLLQDNEAEKLVSNPKFTNLKKSCPAFAETCPFAEADAGIKAALKRCPAFEKTCTFKDARCAHDVTRQLSEAPSSHSTPGTAAHKAVVQTLEYMHETSVQLEHSKGACPEFRQGCPFKTAQTSAGPLVEKQKSAKFASVHPKTSAGQCPIHNPNLVLAAIVVLVAILIARLAGLF